MRGSSVAVLRRHRAQSTELRPFWWRYFRAMAYMNIKTDGKLLEFICMYMKHHYYLDGSRRLGMHSSCPPAIHPCLWRMSCCCVGHFKQCTATIPRAESCKVALLKLLCYGDPNGDLKCKVTSVKSNWQRNWTYNAITSLFLNGTFVRRTNDMEKTQAPPRKIFAPLEKYVRRSLNVLEI